MPIEPESIAQHLPYYLTQDAEEHLARELAAFPNCGPYYISRYRDEVFQGDGWTKLALRRFEDGQLTAIHGIVLSNSCDINPDNRRVLPTKLVFAPIIRLNNYVEKLRASHVQEDRIDSQLRSIREQKVTTLFFLPAGGGLTEDYVALLDDVHSVPFASFSAQRGREKLFTLSNVGFYLFLLKLSVHFCRFHENLPREEESGADRAE